MHKFQTKFIRGLGIIYIYLNIKSSVNTSFFSDLDFHINYAAIT